jgi:dynein heavy chain
MDKIKSDNNSLNMSFVQINEFDKKKNSAMNAASLEKKRAILDVRHRYVLDKFASILTDAKSIDLENSLLFGNKLDYFADFFKENGSKKLILYWQKESSSGKNSLIVSDGKFII